MRLRSIFYFVFILSLAAPSVHATKYDQAGTLEERVRDRILDNGLRIVVVERHSAPVFFTLVSFRVGASHESSNRSGLSHYLEHMLFKGTRTIGTRDYDKEAPIMDELEQVAAEIKEIMIILKSWRYDLFDEYAVKVKAELPADLRETIGADEAAGWRTVRDRLPSDIEDLPAEWKRTPWLVADKDHDYWSLYRSLLEGRARIVELTAEQREFVKQAELTEIYSTHGKHILNAFTSYDQTTYMVGLPSNCLELWMYIESDRFQNPVFREFYSEKEVILEEKRMYENRPGSKLWETFLSTAFRAHPYGRPIIGWMSDIRLTNRLDMEEHFKRFYAPNNCQLTIVGDVDTDEVFRLADEYFGSWKSSQVADEVTVVEPEQNGERRVQVEHDSEPRLLIGWHVPAAPHPDGYVITIIDHILSSGRTSRLYKSIFVEQGLTASSPYSGAEPADRYPNLFFIQAKPKSPHTLGEVETALLAEIDKLKNEPVSDRELDRIRNRFKLNQLERLSSNRWLAFSLNSAFVNRGDWRSITEDFNRLMEVTPDDIQRVANKYLTAKNRTVATLVKPTAIESTDATSMGDNQ